MALRERGGSTPNNTGSDKARDYVRDAYKAFDVDNQYIEDSHKSADERLQDIKETFGDDSARAAELMLQGIIIYDKLERSPGSEELSRSFFGTIDEILTLDKNALRTVIASGMVSTATVRKLIGGNND